MQAFGNVVALLENQIWPVEILLLSSNFCRGIAVSECTELPWHDAKCLGLYLQFVDVLLHVWRIDLSSGFHTGIQCKLEATFLLFALAV